MKRKLNAGPAIGGLITLFAIAAAILTLVPDRTEPKAEVTVPAAAVSAPEMVEVPLADAIAVQGNAALKQIRADARRLTPPDLKDVAVEQPEQ